VPRNPDKTPRNLPIPTFPKIETRRGRSDFNNHYYLLAFFCLLRDPIDDSNSFSLNEPVGRFFRVTVQEIQGGVIEPNWIKNENQIILPNASHRISVSAF
jgi:hypothetical protein